MAITVFVLQSVARGNMKWVYYENTAKYYLINFHSTKTMMIFSINKIYNLHLPGIIFVWKTKNIIFISTSTCTVKHFVYVMELRLCRIKFPWNDWVLYRNILFCCKHTHSLHKFNFYVECLKFLRKCHFIHT